MKKNTGLLIASTIDLVLLALSVFANIQGIISGEPFQFSLNLIAVLFALYYCFFGYKKSANLYFRIFCGFLAVKEAIAIIWVATNEKVPAFTYILLIICYSSALLLAVAKDLGKVNSFILVGAMTLVGVASVIFVIVSASATVTVFYNATRLILALVLCVMVWAKYEDKSTRITK